MNEIKKWRKFENFDNLHNDRQYMYLSKKLIDIFWGI